MEEEKGVRRVVWIPLELDALIEEVRNKIGLSRSGFYRNAILRYLESLSIISGESLLKDVKKKRIPEN
jgi:hypothetical protein